MQCRMCGYEFDEKKTHGSACSNCGNSKCGSVHCPNCGYANSPEYEEEFEFIKKLKNKIKKTI